MTNPALPGPQPDEPLIEFEVIGTPKATPRPRSSVIKSGPKKGRVRTYMPSTAEAWKSSIMAAVRPMLPASPVHQSVYLSVVFRLPRPKAHYRTGRYAGLLRHDHPRTHRQKPDVDNLLKGLMDALSDVQVWVDDTIVVGVSASKVWSERGGASVALYAAGDPFEEVAA